MDRHAPAGFESVDFGGESVLKLSLLATDQHNPVTDAYHNIQGRRYLLPNVQVVSADVYLPAEWATGSHRASLWATGVEGDGEISGWPSLAFENDGTIATFFAWDNLGRHDLTAPVAYGQWLNFRIQRNASTVTYYIDDVLVYTSSYLDDTWMATSVGFSEIMLQAKNFGVDDAVYFDNVVPVPNPAPVPDTAVVSDITELETALDDSAVTTIIFDADITSDHKVLVGRPVAINGAGFDLTMTDNVPAHWDGDYVLHVYDTTGVTISNIKLTGGDAGLLVNSSAVTLTGSIDVSGNEYGGIESSKGSAPGLSDPTLNVTGVVFTNTTEAYGLPTIWEDVVTGTITGAGPFTQNATVKLNQVQYYLQASNAVAP